MLQTNFIKILLLFLATNLCFSQYTDVINSNRPGESMSAFSVGKTIFQVEAGLSKIKETHDTKLYEASGYAADITMRWGLFAEQLELDINYLYQADDYVFNNVEMPRSGARRTLFGFKYMLYDPYKNYEEKPNLLSYKANHRFKWRRLRPSVALYAGTNLNFSSNPYSLSGDPLFAPKIMLITQNQFEGSQVFVMNFFMDKISSPNVAYGYVLTYTKGFNDHWSAFIENKGIKSEVYSDGILTGGAAYLFKKNTQIDISISQSFKNTPNLFYGGIGLSWRFDANYKEVKIKKSKTDKNKKDDKKDKAKEKEKKRIDDFGVPMK